MAGFGVIDVAGAEHVFLHVGGVTLLLPFLVGTLHVVLMERILHLLHLLVVNIGAGALVVLEHLTLRFHNFRVGLGHYLSGLPSVGYNSCVASTATIQLPPLTRQSMSELVAKAKRLGMEPGAYAKRLIEDGLAFQREAEESSFAEIMGPVRDAAGAVDDSEIQKLVDSARTERPAAARRKKR